VSERERERERAVLVCLLRVMAGSLIKGSVDLVPGSDVSIFRFC
jgi:hypothetical protein